MLTLYTPAIGMVALVELILYAHALANKRKLTLIKTCSDSIQIKFPLLVHKFQIDSIQIEFPLYTVCVQYLIVFVQTSHGNYPSNACTKPQASMHAGLYYKSL